MRIWKLRGSKRVHAWRRCGLSSGGACCAGETKEEDGEKKPLGFQQMPQKDEEHFMELIFPGYKTDTSIWNVTLFQICCNLQCDLSYTHAAHEDDLLKRHKQ